MNRKTLLMLGLALLVGVLLGVGGARYVGSLAPIARVLNSLPVPGVSHPAAPRVAPKAPAQQETQDARDAHDHESDKVVRLTPAKMQQFGIDVAVAGAGSLQTQLHLPGTVTLNTDRRIHIVPRISGVVREVRVNLGAHVRAGEIMAVIDSRELADAKAAYLAARERVALAETTFTREKDLWEKRISPAEDYFKAKQALAEAGIELRAVTHKLLALGFTKTYIQQLSGQPEASWTRYDVVAPFAGTVIEKRIAIGALLKDDTEAFVVADLSTVWVDLTVAPKDLPLVRKDQRVVVAADTVPAAEGTLSYIGQLMSEETRTVMARVVLPNPDGHWRPGLFVTAMLTVETRPVAVLISKLALQTIDGKSSVFVQMAAGFEPRPVTLGRANETHVEITSGLQAGERYVATETFVLKAELGKGTAEHDH